MEKMEVNMKKFLILFSTILCFCIFAQENEVKQEITEKVPAEYELKYIYNIGDILTYSLKVENYEKLNISGQSTEKRRTTIIDFSQKTEDVDEKGNGIIKLKYLSGIYNNIKIDFGDKEATLKRNTKGEILESTGLQEASMEFIKIIQKSASDYIPGLDRLPVKMDFSNYDSNLFNPYLESFTPVFPDKKIKIGDTWEREIILPFLFTKGKMVYTLEKIEENKAFIKLSLSRREISGSGDVIFDIEKGKLVEENITIKAENIKTKIDLGKFTQYKQVYEISGMVIMKVNLKEK